MGKDSHTMALMRSSESPEWWTPADIIDLVRDTLGTIDYDPCTCEEANKTVRADNIFTKDDGGMALWPSTSWGNNGTLFMNPPYGRGIRPWVDKLNNEYRCGHIREAITLLPARVETRWWKTVREYTVCFWSGRVLFIGDPPVTTAAPFPSALVYLGEDDSRFVEVFSKHGLIYRPVVV